MTTRPGALLGVFDISLTAFSLLLMVIVAFIAQQIAVSGAASGAFFGAGIGLLMNFLLSLPSRLIFTASSGIPDSRIEWALDKSGFGPYRTDDCFAPKRWRRAQFPAQWIHMTHTERGTELVGPLLVLRHIKRLVS